MVQNVIQIKKGITINVDGNRKSKLNMVHTRSSNIWNPNTCACGINYTYTKNLIDNSVVACDEIIDVVTKS